MLNIRQAADISAQPETPVVVFSDLDGSLLDHDSYSFEPARPALDALRASGIPLVLVSSKTLAELEDYRQALNLEHPVVAENGARTWVPDSYFDDSIGSALESVTRADLQDVYTSLKQAGQYNCKAFFELGIEGISRETGLSEARAGRANERAASEPILWLDTDARATEFIDAVHKQGLRCVRGGRFLHLMANTGKEDAVRNLTAAYERLWNVDHVTSVSLGDGPNDLGMLATTDIGVIIPGRHRHSMELTSDNRILWPADAGPTGWNEAMLQILAELDVQRTTLITNGA